MTNDKDLIESREENCTDIPMRELARRLLEENSKLLEIIIDAESNAQSVISDYWEYSKPSSSLHNTERGALLQMLNSSQAMMVKAKKIFTKSKEKI